MIDKILSDLRSGDFLDALPVAICGLAIAGSHARGEQVEHSDLDLFVVIDATSRTEYQFQVESALGFFPPPLMRRGPVWVPHFGDSVTLVYPEWKIVQLNFNTWATLEVNPMRSQSIVLLDRFGKYAKLVEQAAERTIDKCEIYQSYSDWCLIRAGFALHSIRKGELLKATMYLNDMKVALGQLARLSADRFYERRNPYLPISRFEDEMDSYWVGRLGKILPAYEIGSIERSLSEGLALLGEIHLKSASAFSYDTRPSDVLMPSLMSGE